jgi:hypothetical protein
VLRDEREQRRCVSYLRHHVEPGLGEQARETVTDQHGAVCRDEPHGTHASTTVPLAAADATANVPPSASTPANPCNPDPAGSAPPTPSSTTRIRAPSSADTSVRVADAANVCLAAFVNASLAT